VGDDAGVKRYTWRGVDDPSRIDRVHVAITDGGMRAFGTATSDTFATAWRLDVDPGWTTRRLEVASRGIDWSRNLVLERDAGGVWATEGEATGGADLPPPGLADPSSVEGAQDCDLGLCPLTNTMPVRRLGLLERQLPETTLTMAWVEVPSLRVIRSDQVYASAGRGRVRFRTADGAFEAVLDIDRDGIVRNYPGLAIREESP
jgi:hypothetical protein